VESSSSTFQNMSRDELLRALEMFAKNWLAHDGCWFLAAEERLGLEAAIELDARSWARFAAVEARRIIATFNIPAGGGLPALELALGLRLYSLINTQRVQWADDRQRLFLFMDVCRVQQTVQKCSRLFRRYTGLTTSNTDFSGIGFIHLRLLRKTPFLTTGKARAQESLKWRELRFPACGWSLRVGIRRPS